MDKKELAKALKDGFRFGAFHIRIIDVDEAQPTLTVVHDDMGGGVAFECGGKMRPLLTDEVIRKGLVEHE